MTCSPTPNDSIAKSCRRIEPRILTPGQTATMQLTTEVDVVNQSKNGVCIRFDTAIDISLNKEIMLIVGGVEKTAIVRWIKVDDNNKNAKTVGCEFLSV